MASITGITGINGVRIPTHYLNYNLSNILWDYNNDKQANLKIQKYKGLLQTALGLFVHLVARELSLNTGY